MNNNHQDNWADILADAVPAFLILIVFAFIVSGAVIKSCSVTRSGGEVQKTTTTEVSKP